MYVLSLEIVSSSSLILISELQLGDLTISLQFQLSPVRIKDIAVLMTSRKLSVPVNHENTDFADFRAS